MKLLADQIDIEFLAKRTQPYLNVMHKAILMMGYFGLLRIGEMTIGESNRTICFSDVHFEHNRSKILILLRSSKMHTTTSKPQSMKIEHISGYGNKYCPCKIICDDTLMRGARRPKAPFFIFRDMTPVKADQFRSVLHRWYWIHLCMTPTVCAKDLFKLEYTVDQIKEKGRWRSNAVYEYLK